MALKSISHLSILVMVCIAIYLFYDLSTALIFSSIAALSILIIGFFICVLGLFKFGYQVTAEVEINFFELLLLIGSLAVPFAFLLTAVI